MPTRPTLTHDRVIAAAVDLADQIGAGDLTIRKLADALGTKPMSLYHHVANKDAILDGMVDAVFAEITPPPEGMPWAAAMRTRCESAREVLLRHAWSVPLLESRTSPGPATLAHHDAVLHCLRRGGLSMAVTAHAYAVLDAFVYGFVLQEASLPFSDEGGEVAEVAGDILEQMGEAFPSLAAFTVEHAMAPGYRFGDSFAVGLDLLLSGIAGLGGRGG